MQGAPAGRPERDNRGDCVAWGRGCTHQKVRCTGPVDDVLAELGMKRKIASVVPGFPTALSVALQSDLIRHDPRSLFS